eukprot:13991603-Alexandrium_andersonii.AAC.2
MLYHCRRARNPGNLQYLNEGAVTWHGGLWTARAHHLRARAPECGAVCAGAIPPVRAAGPTRGGVPLGLTRSQPCKGTP